MTPRFAVIGNPIAHSLSPRIHSLFARQLGIALVYEKLLASQDGFVRAATQFFADGGMGLNVTLPFKETAYEWVTTRDERAGAAGAVNTIVRAGDEGFFGSNTDGVGLVRDLRRLGVRLQEARMLLLGAGGAVRGVVGPLLGEAPRSIVIANRTIARAEALVARFEDPRLRVVLLSALEGPFDLIVNGTSAGLDGVMPTIDDQIVRSAFCYDMVYGASASPFLSWGARGRAGGVADGLGMLVEQAAEAFWLWHHERPATAGVLERVRAEITGSTR